VLIDGDPIAIKREDLVVGEPVPWRLFDREQRLLAKEGMVITSERQIEALLMRGAMRYETVERHHRRRPKKKLPKETYEPQKPDTFSDYHTVAEELMEQFYRLQDEPESLTQVVAGIIEIAGRLRSLVVEDPEKALVALHLMNEYPYIVIHPIHVAIIAMLMELSFDKDDAHQTSMVCAALTQNLAMNDLQEDLFTQLFPLDDEQRQLIQAHPQQTVEMLQQAGIGDPLWLEIIRQHHEREDGSGYPRGLTEADILTEAKVIALADRYSAMSFERPFRETKGPRAILQAFYNESQINKRKLPLQLIQQLGVYPPGLFVRLHNGETAMVVKRSGPNGKPMVVSFINPRGGAFEPPLLRDTGANPIYAVKGVCAIDPGSFDLDNIWGVVSKVRGSG
jgi:HD-GYP domain-containing protein (c-di-GMP phosphodiesterase class II)